MKEQWNNPEIIEIDVKETEKSPNLGTNVDHWEIVGDHWEVWAS